MLKKYRFGTFELSERAGQLSREGNLINIRAKSFKLLNFLLTRAGELVSRDELLGTLWPGLTVEDAALTVCVHELRQVLQDDSHRPRFIRTAHGRGYCFIAPVEGASVGEGAGQAAHPNGTNEELAKEQVGLEEANTRVTKLPPALAQSIQLAQAALGRSESEGALAHAHRGLELLATMPEASERWQAELQLQMLIVSAQAGRLGLASAAVARACGRGMELLGRLGDSPASLQAVLGLSRYYLVRDELDGAQSLAQRAVRIAARCVDPSAAKAAQATVAAILYSRADFRASYEQAEQVISRAEAAPRQPSRYGLDSDVIGFLYAGLCLWRLGYAERARARMREGLGWAEQAGHTHSVAMALAANGSLMASCRDWTAHLDWAERLLAVTGEHPISYWRAWGSFYRGRALFCQGRQQLGEAAMQEGIAALRATGAPSQQAEEFRLLTRAEAGCDAAQAREGLHLASLWQERVVRTDKRLDEAELCRAIGLLHLGAEGSTQTRHCAAEEAFQRALWTARRQQALIYELRAAIELGRLWQRVGKERAASDLVGEIYGRFTEGLDSEDLRQARALIEEPGQGRARPTGT